MIKITQLFLLPGLVNPAFFQGISSSLVLWRSTHTLFIYSLYINDLQRSFYFLLTDLVLLFSSNTLSMHCRPKLDYKTIVCLIEIKIDNLPNENPEIGSSFFNGKLRHLNSLKVWLNFMINYFALVWRHTTYNCVFKSKVF